MGLLVQLCRDGYPSQNAHSPFVFDVGMFDMQKAFPVVTESTWKGKDDLKPL